MAQTVTRAGKLHVKVNPVYRVELGDAIKQVQSLILVIVNLLYITCIQQLMMAETEEIFDERWNELQKEQ